MVCQEALGNLGNCGCARIGTADCGPDGRELSQLQVSPRTDAKERDAIFVERSGGHADRRSKLESRRIGLLAFRQLALRALHDIRAKPRGCALGARHPFGQTPDNRPGQFEFHGADDLGVTDNRRPRFGEARSLPLNAKQQFPVARRR